MRASPVRASAWQRQPPKSFSLRGQDRQGSRIQSVPRKALKAGNSAQISASARSRTDQKASPGILSAAWQGSRSIVAIPSRRGAPIHFPLRPLKTAQDCADVITDLLSNVAEGQLTPDEASQLSGIVSKRAELFGTIELAAEIGALKSQLAALGSAPRPPSPIRRPFAIT